MLSHLPRLAPLLVLAGVLCTLPTWAAHWLSRAHVFHHGSVGHADVVALIASTIASMWTGSVPFALLFGIRTIPRHFRWMWGKCPSCGYPLQNRFCTECGRKDIEVVVHPRNEVTSLLRWLACCVVVSASLSAVCSAMIAHDERVFLREVAAARAVNPHATHRRPRAEPWSGFELVAIAGRPIFVND